MRHIAALGVLISAVLPLVSCNDDSSDEPLPPSAKQPAERKQETLTREEYPVMREVIVSEPDDATELQPICKKLDAAPDTLVIKATRNACDRLLSLYNERESIRNDLEDACTPGEFEACADATGPLRRLLFDTKRVFVAYRDDVDKAMASGPCRDVLVEKDELAQLDGFINKFDEAVRALRRGNPKPFQELPEFDSDLDDPTPCRPA